MDLAVVVERLRLADKLHQEELHVPMEEQEEQELQHQLMELQPLMLVVEAELVYQEQGALEVLVEVDKDVLLDSVQKLERLTRVVALEVESVQALLEQAVQV